MAAISYKQDKAPPGGYPEFRFAQTISRKGPSGLAVIFGGVALQVIGFYFVVKANKKRRELRKEQLNGRLCLLPLIQAEEDRRSAMIDFLKGFLMAGFKWFIADNRILKGLKLFEAEEAQIMKDVPGWKVGESVYNTDKWVPPNIDQLKFVDGH